MLPSLFFIQFASFELLNVIIFVICQLQKCFLCPSYPLGYQCQDNFTAEQTTERHAKDRPADKLQTGRRTMGTRHSTGQ